MAFGQATTYTMGSSCIRLAETAQELIVKLAGELVTRDEALAAAPPLLNTPPRSTDYPKAIAQVPEKSVGRELGHDEWSC